jgi:hypothetical protein
MEEFIFNGIDGATGDYLLPVLTAAALSAIARGEVQDESLLAELRRRHELESLGGFFGVGEGIDPADLAQTGWGLILAHDADPAIRDALGELIDWRRVQASQTDERGFKIFAGPDGYRPGESKNEFLARHGMGPGVPDPQKVPYYLLIAGSPESIPYRFQTQLDVQYAVGRVHFDSLEEYARYAHSVVEAEKVKLALPRKISFFGVSNPGDRATSLSAQELVQPLAEAFAADYPDWVVESVLKEKATKSELAARMGGLATPGMLFTASHGMGFPHGDARQFPHQGALLCQDWPGPENWRKPIPQDFYFAGDDLLDDARLFGLIAFHFACYGAGTPLLDEFARQAFKARSEIAPRAFLAALPQRMLSHPKGGALAVVGHVDRAWGYSFLWAKAGRQLTVFRSALGQLMHGLPIGAALEFFNERYAEISSDLSVLLEDIAFGKTADDLEVAGMWTANNDARNYVILGDPAVRLMVGEQVEGEMERPEAVIVLSPIESRAPEGALEKPGGETTQPAPAPGEVFDYGLGDIFRQAGASLGTGLGKLVDKLGDFLGKALDDASSLEVATYVSQDVSQVRFEGGRFTGANLRALTLVKIDGDTLVCVPQDEGEVNSDLWRIHLEMLQQAQASRTELLKTAVSAVTNLAGLLKP